MPIKVHVFHPQAHALHQSHAGAVLQTRQQSGNAIHLRQKAHHFVFGLHRWNAFGMLRPPNVVQPRQFDIQYFAVLKQQRTERLVVCGGRNLALISHHA